MPMRAPILLYIDPTVGGMLVQLIAGGLAGFLAFVRLYFRRLRQRPTK